jgi:phosphoribosyl-ATP pyrophosphohydrolase
MSTQSKYLNIDHLRNFEVDPAYFGLGFIQLKIDIENRIHFYHDVLPVLSETPHDHRYKFTSHVLQGTLEQTLFQWDNTPVGDHEKHLVDCSATSNLLTRQPPINGRITPTLRASFTSGSWYEIEANTLHTVSGKNNAITHLQRGEAYKDFATVVAKNGDNIVCPFSDPITTSRCWELIEDMLPKKKKKKKNKKHGYHIMDIPKGTIGEPDKIVEEAMEIMDAHQQGVRIMAATEMADLYGALDRYRERHHADLTMTDIHAMYVVTRRAFDSGRRT